MRRLRAADQQTFTLAVENERGADQLQVQLRVEGELRQLQPEQTTCKIPRTKSSIDLDYSVQCIVYY